MNNDSKWWIGITYLLYLIFWDGMFFGATIYAVLERGWSPWWFLGAIFMAASVYPPHQWAQLWNGKVPTE